MNCGVGRRLGSDPSLLWLWCRLAAAALIGPLAWEPPYAVGMALKNPKKNINTPKNKNGVQVSPVGPVEKKKNPKKIQKKEFRF